MIPHETIDNAVRPTASHVAGEPAILYFGTPVVLVSSADAAGRINLAPISSAFWLRWRCVIGIGATSLTTANLRATGSCVLNLPSSAQAEAVNALALTTGSDPVPPGKLVRGYRTEGCKFAAAGLTPVAAECVDAPRAGECPVQMEAVVEAEHSLAADDPAQRGQIVTFELRILRVHLARDILLNGDPDRVDPDRWRPMIMSFQKLYGLAPEQAAPSVLAKIPERLYRGPDIERAREALSG